MSEFAPRIVNQLFPIGLSLESARSIAGNGPAGDRIAAATDKVDRLIREIRHRVFAEPAHATGAGLPMRSWQDDPERSAQTADRAALLQEHMARTARALQANAAEYAALLGQGAGLARQPGRMNGPAEIEWWRAFADQAQQIARRWEQPP
jgi:hypothetical protein